jgi:hypothetical protein
MCEQGEFVGVRWLACVHALEQRFTLFAGVHRHSDQDLVEIALQLSENFTGELFRWHHLRMGGASAASVTSEAGVDNRRDHFHDPHARRLQLLAQTEGERVNRCLGRTVDRNVSHR